MQLGSDQAGSEVCTQLTIIFLTMYGSESNIRLFMSTCVDSFLERFFCTGCMSGS
jgi:hypothetical protein